MKTVYGVWSGYEDMDGIFSTAEKALEYIQKEIDAKKCKRERFSILEYEIDGLIQ